MSPITAPTRLDHPAPPIALRPACGTCAETPWGEAWQLGSAAFWAEQAADFSLSEGRHRLGQTLREEVAVCILGGYGVPGQVGNAAFVALRDAGLLAMDLDETSAVAAMTELLAQPLDVGNGRRMRYRFYRQRPRRLVSALTELSTWEHEADAHTDVELRNRLIVLPGIGPKTASWIVRNHRDSDEVAIIDVHIRRAGISAGLFCTDWVLPRHYELFEQAFLSWAAYGAVSAANLDAAIWRMLSSLGRQGRSMVLGF